MCLKNYASGDIIVMAISAEAARQEAKLQVDHFLKGHRCWWFDSDGVLCPDDKEEYDEFIQKLDKDLTVEPDVVETGVVFINGSE
jgi:hypothetical protein